MANKRNAIILGLGVTLTFFMLTLVPKQAVQAAAPSFTAQVTSDDQSTMDNQYFELNLQTGQQTTTQILVQNLIAVPNKIQIKPIVATTSSDGHAVYTSRPGKSDKSLKHKFTQLTGPTQTITLPPHGEQTVTFNVTTPKEKDFVGLIMGGYQVSSLTAGSVKSPGSSKADITNKVNYAFPALVSVNGGQEKIRPELTVGRPQINAYATMPYLNTLVRNIKPNLLTAMTLKFQVRTNKGKKVFSTQQSNLSMAANSNFELSLRWQPNRVVAGDYEAIYDFKTKSQSWRFRRHFTITDQQAGQLNRQNQQIQPNYWPLFIIAGLLILILLVVFSWVIYYKGKKRGGR
ncbi:WxL protein host-binding domain-containing protein [Agrilactobacillus fermenti]|uniref:WxL protein host-binding domain-containing protein n=1 Tax=Agrilactobacillus fermenti TaxID=2586909 RepID=UPI003A5C2B23